MSPSESSANQAVTSGRVASADTTTLFGFWIYIITDLVVFSILIAVFEVMHNNTSGGPSLGAVTDPGYALVETIALLSSSFACGLGWIAAARGRRDQMLAALCITWILGAVFIGLELHDFADLFAQGNGWRRSGALSSYVTLVGTHGLHVAVGLLWLAVMLVRTWRSGVSHADVRRLALFSIFWHVLDVVWIFIFTFVYLMSVHNQ